MEDPDIKFTCKGCRTQVMKMEKQLKLHKPPQVLALHLKRFKNDGVSIEKIDKFVDYPIELDLSPFLSSTENVSSFLFLSISKFHCCCTKPQNLMAWRMFLPFY
jgi:ubiquitin C-terminal hydrolase